MGRSGNEATWYDDASRVLRLEQSLLPGDDMSDLFVHGRFILVHTLNVFSATVFVPLVTCNPTHIMHRHRNTNGSTPIMRKSIKNAV